MKKILSAILMIALIASASTSAFASSGVNELALDKTGTTYDFIDISFAPTVAIDGEDGISSVEKMVPEFQFGSDARGISSSRLEVRFASEFTVNKEDAKTLGTTYYAEAINDIVILAAEQGVSIIPDMDDPDFQLFAKSQALVTSDQNVIDLIKFIDIYENYEHNLKMETLVSTLENTIFTSTGDFITDPSLNELLSMMPVTGMPTAETAPLQLATEADGSTRSLSGYDADAAVEYAATWWNKTNNTDYGYYADYADHPDPNNNNMWSGGTGNNRRTWQDCANFVSQCLEAGGAEYIGWNPLTHATDNQYWFYSNIRPSYSWGGASNFYYHWGSRVGTRSHAGLTQKGDPVSVDNGGDNIPDHTIIITSINEDTGSLSDMKYACHTSDQYEAEGKSLQTIYDTYEAVWVYEVG